MEDIDIYDIIFAAIGIMVTASFAQSTSLWIALPVLFLLVAQHYIRRTAIIRSTIEKSDKITRVNNVIGLLPAPNTEEYTVNHKVSGEIIVKEEKQPIQTILPKLPLSFSYRDFTKLSGYQVPIGITSGRKHIFASVKDEILHALIAGTSGTGKDSILKLWYTYLTIQNTPDDIQFVILDGKGEWLLPGIKESAFNFLPPVGGQEIEIIRKDNGKREIVNKTTERMQDTIINILNEMDRRMTLFNSVGVNDYTRYIQKTGKTLPILVVVLTDVGADIDELLSALIKQIIYKARSLGIRIWISMQSSVGQSTGWRNNIGFKMVGKLETPQHDSFVLGNAVSTMMVRPSDLPTPTANNPGTLGLFVVKLSGNQYLVKTPFLPEITWENYVENKLLRADEWKNKRGEFLLDELLSKSPRKVNDRFLSPERQKLAIALAKNGSNKTQIMRALGITSGDDYRLFSPEVEDIIKRKQ